MKVFFLLILILNQCFAGEISLSFDDAPTKSANLFTGLERTRLIIKKLKKANVKAVFYVNSNRIQLDDGDLRLKEYAKEDHILGNHTHSHPKITEVELDKYKEEILKTHDLIKNYSSFKPWFRFPYLKRGNDISTRDTIRNFLKENNYYNAYVTVDNFDWSMESLLQRALRKGVSVSEKKVCKAYSEILWESIKYYDDMALKYLNRSPSHVLLLHENDIAALCLDKLVKLIQEKGWKLVSPVKSYKDNIASKEPDTLYLGQGRVASIIHETTGVKIRSKWENVDTLKAEFDRRKTLK